MQWEYSFPSAGWLLAIGSLRLPPLLCAKHPSWRDWGRTPGLKNCCIIDRQLADPNSKNSPSTGQVKHIYPRFGLYNKNPASGCFSQGSHWTDRTFGLDSSPERSCYLKALENEHGLRDWYCLSINMAWQTPRPFIQTSSKRL